SPCRPRPKSTSAIADGSVKPSQAASPPGSPARKIPIAIMAWLLAGAGGAGQKLAEGDQIGIGRLVEPAPAQHVLAAEVAQVRHRPTKRGEAQPHRDGQDLEERPRGRCGGWV